ncbi:MAG: TA system VapC family ribonuclease toxin [Gemmatimonadota bacterium]|nr:TA system VapC family ribonuclease toxin [Gemmatimonadota bacterium]
MSAFLLDINVVIAIVDPCHQFHEPVHTWIAGSRDAGLLTTPIVQLGVVRVLSQPRYPNHMGTAAQALVLLRGFSAHPRHRFCADDLSLVAPGLLARESELTPGRLTDLYLLALAARHGAKLATFDRRIPVEAIVGGGAALELLEA